MSETGIGCIFQLIVLVIWGFIGSWLIGLTMNMWVSEHSWFELGWGLRWLVGLFIGKFALIALIIGVIAGTIIGFPIITIGG
jgi:hypothetical protein